MKPDLTDPHVQRIDRLAISAGLTVSERAYVLATAYHETGAFRWLREIWGPTKAQQRYEGRADLGNNVPGDGKRYLGRGYVQITGRRNYADWGRRLGLDLTARPELAEEPETAATILVEGMRLGTFTGQSLADHFGAGRAEYLAARAIVNGTDRAGLIAGYARDFEGALQAVEKPAKTRWLTGLLRRITDLFRRKQ